ncbi:uncharacterized protein LOC126251785 [Schistocerca nitens]|uniref:uncharacterized protein LOC126188859 n=1 Tax=Schistocerca cancellata TaxID=274614 RepID=UPI0021173FFB|nr:uncharacterized protein LOC126188859 [Schistocerca cancellata]XP_049808373.1 uncharacterized protein LOC126251785 [Schistocerca nitens]
MASVDMSLDDIIQKKIVKTPYGRARLKRNQQKNESSRNVKRNNAPRKRGGITKISDARLKIIQNKRQKLTDARDKLAEIAKKSDAREKLEKLRLKRMKGRPGSQVNANITRRTNRNGQVTLSTNKNRESWPRNKDNILPNSRGFRSSAPALMDMDIDFNDEHDLLPPVIRRTVNNETSFRGHGIHDSTFSWGRDCPPSPSSLLSERRPLLPSRHTSTPDSSSLEAIVRSSAARSHKNHGSLLLSEREEWKRDNSLLRPSSLRLRSGLDDSEEEGPWAHRMSSELKARLDTPSSVHHTPSSSQGHRIVVSNLQPSVTQEDIRELFEDIGTLVVSRLVRPGTAEVVYARLEDALRAVDVYHNRQLDGQPMKCMLVNSRPPVLQSGSRSSSTGLRSTSDAAIKLPTGTKSSVAPDIGTIHKALFNKS